MNYHSVFVRARHKLSVCHWCWILYFVNYQWHWNTLSDKMLTPGPIRRAICESDRSLVSNRKVWYCVDWSTLSSRNIQWQTVWETVTVKKLVTEGQLLFWMCSSLAVHSWKYEFHCRSLQSCLRSSYGSGKRYEGKMASSYISKTTPAS